MDIRNTWALLTFVTCSGKPGQTRSRSGILLVHIAAVGLTTATLPILSCVVAIAGMALYMIGAKRTLNAAECAKPTLRA